MKSIVYRVVLLLIVLGLAGNAAAFERKAEWAKYARPGKYDPAAVNGTALTRDQLDSDLGRISYSIGMSIGEDIKTRGIKIDSNLLARGIADMLNDEQTAITKEEAMQVLAQLQQQLATQQRDELERQLRENLQRGQAFLKQNAQREGVVVTASGLQYEILTAGTGATPSPESVVTVDYRGMYIDGQEFDSSYQRGEPVEFSVNGIIPGWSEALLLMQEGAKWRLFIPADLAYGVQGAPPVIEPNSTLIFEVELKAIQK